MKGEGNTAEKAETYFKFVEKDSKIINNVGISTGNSAGKITERVSKPTGRMNMANKTHPVSGVKFDSNGFPIFKSEYNMHLEEVDYLKSRATHFSNMMKYSVILNWQVNLHRMKLIFSKKVGYLKDLHGTITKNQV